MEMSWHPVSLVLEDWYNHFIRVDYKNRIIRLWSDAFQDETLHEKDEIDVLINPKGGKYARLAPNGIENPPLYSASDIPIYGWDVSKSTKEEPWRGIIERTEKEIQADLDEQLNSPANQIASLNQKINEGLTDQVAHLYDLYQAGFSSMNNADTQRIKQTLGEIMPAMTDEEFKAVQVKGTPSSTGISYWREMVYKRDTLLKSKLYETD